MDLSRVVSAPYKTRYGRFVQTDRPRPSLVLCATFSRFFGFSCGVQPDRSATNHGFTAAGLLHVRDHRMEFFLQLCESGRLHLSHQRSDFSKDLLPAPNHATEPYQHESAEFPAPTVSTFRRSRFLRSYRSRYRAQCEVDRLTCYTGAHGITGPGVRLPDRGGHREISGSDHDRRILS